MKKNQLSLIVAIVGFIVVFVSIEVGNGILTIIGLVIGLALPIAITYTSVGITITKYLRTKDKSDKGLVNEYKLSDADSNGERPADDDKPGEERP